MRGFFRVLFTPSCWVQNESYNASWDAALNQLMKEHKFTNASIYEANLGTNRIWITNHPYASFVCPITKSRPKRITILSAMDKLVKDIYDTQ